MMATSSAPGGGHHRTSFRIDDILPPTLTKPPSETVFNESVLSSLQLSQHLFPGHFSSATNAGTGGLGLCVSPQAYQNLWLSNLAAAHGSAGAYPRWMCSAAAAGRLDGGSSVIMPTPGFHMPPYFQSNHLPHDSSSDHQSSSKQCRRRKARTVFSDSQLNGLEKRFETQRYLSTPERVDLANNLNLSETQVKTWFKHKKLLRKHKDETSSTRPHLLASGTAMSSPFLKIEPGGLKAESSCGRSRPGSSSGSDISDLSSEHSRLSPLIHM